MLRRRKYSWYIIEMRHNTRLRKDAVSSLQIFATTNVQGHSVKLLPSQIVSRDCHCSPPTTSRRTIVVLRPHVPAPRQPLRAARKEDNNSAEKRAGSGSKDCPNGNTILGMRASLVVFALIDVLLDNREEDKVNDERHERHEESEQRDHGSEERAEDACAQREQEGEEGHAQHDGVEDHDFGEGVGGFADIVGEFRGVDIAQDLGGIVADLRVGAVVLIILPGILLAPKYIHKAGRQYSRCVCYTVPKCSEDDFRLVT